MLVLLSAAAVVAFVVVVIIFVADIIYSAIMPLFFTNIFYY